jgi:hypothetical protein
MKLNYKTTLIFYRSSFITVARCNAWGLDAQPPLSARHVRLMVSKRGLVLERSALYNASRVMPDAFQKVGKKVGMNA